MRRTWLVIGFLACLLVSDGWAATTLRGKVAVSGNREYAGPVVIEQGTVLSFEKGATCTFRGDVVMRGTTAKPVRFLGSSGAAVVFDRASARISGATFDAFDSIVFGESSGELASCTFRKCSMGLKITKSSSLTVRDSRFEGNEIGVVAELKSSSVLQNIQFVKSAKAGIVVAQYSKTQIHSSQFTGNDTALTIDKDGAALVSGCTIKGNVQGVVMNQNNTSEFRKSTFSSNKTAFKADLFCNIVLTDSTFTDNEDGVVLHQSVAGKIAGCTFERNGTAIALDRKSSPDIRTNTFRKNKTAVVCDYSSYPVITLNNFIENAVHIRLGQYQSADFENRVSSKAIQLQEVVSMGSRRVKDFDRRQVFVGEVFAKKNYWDDATRAEIDAKENVTTIIDGRDLGAVKYEGFGDDSYWVDTVVMKPYLDKPYTRRN